MSKIELTISTDYVPAWTGAWHGIRELVANGLDAEVELNAPLSLTWHGDTIRIENSGAVLPREALLLGNSTKRDNHSTIGSWGEGMKLSLLCLLRDGYQIKIRSGSEVWVPAIVHSEKFDAKVLSIDIQGNRKNENRVRFEVSPVTKEEFDLIQTRFLKLSSIPDNQSIKTPYGELLTGPDRQGHVYVRGVFIKKSAGLHYGYNFTDGQLNRDRDLVGDLQYRTKNLLEAATAQRPDLFDIFFKLIEDGAEDVSGIDRYTAVYLNDKTKLQAAAKFKERFGDDIIPVASMGDSKEVEHLGKRSVMVTPALLAILSEKIETLEQAKIRLKDEIVKKYSWTDLSDVEKASYDNAIQTLRRVTGDTLLGNLVEVVDFKSPTLYGLYKGDGRIFLSKSRLSSESVTLATLVHEYAHSATGAGDGDQGHIGAVEFLWTRIYESLKDPAWKLPAKATPPTSPEDISF